MSKKRAKSNYPIKISMQFFAEGGGNGENQGEGELTPPNYDELIKTDKQLQSFLDQRVNTATSTAVLKALEKERLLADEKVSEAEKLASMTKEEKQEYELKKLRKLLSDHEQEKGVRSLTDEAVKIAAEKGVPQTLVHLLPFAQMKAEQVSTKIDELKTIYDKAIADGISSALAGAGKPNGAGSADSSTVGEVALRKAMELN